MSILRISRASHHADCMQIHYIELPKIADLLRKPPEALSEIEFWSMLILAGRSGKVRKLLAAASDREEEMSMAQALLNTMSRDRQEWENQFGYEKFVHDCISREKYAYYRGEQRGISQGMQQGERNARLEAARRMLIRGKSTPEEIAEDTGLSADEVKSLL